ncbi:type III secretion system inner rod subunit SctI [Acidovorax sp.]|uniref:type III secretion system inner rod subunit SctI n=1 Tax=Acidovorax sp. TaxID=1872122 RepID=UPI00262AFF95|nr:type III secretion system inner rod subunit SctI [Acidovorax sp.]
MDIIASPMVATALPALSAPAVATAVPDASATARFAALMQAPAPTAMDNVAASMESRSMVNGSTPAAIQGPSSVGDRILAGMQGVSGEFQSAWKSVAASLDAGPQAMGMQDLLKLQLQLVQVSVQYDLVGKAVSRSTQNFDQLVRIQ